MGCMERSRAGRNACAVVVVADADAAAAGTYPSIVAQGDADEVVPKQRFRIVAAEDHCSSAIVGRLEEEERRSQLPRH